jgi:nicotinamide-nucleotide amidase
MARVIAETRARAVLDAARAQGLMIATAESCTGGMVAAALTDIPGSSDVFERGYVTYSNGAKTDLLGVPERLIAEHGAVSAPVARAMADGARARAGVALAVAITGVAGPGGSEAKPEGLVFLAVAGPGGVTDLRRDFGPIGRAAIRQASAEAALDLLLQSLSASPLRSGAP